MMLERMVDGLPLKARNSVQGTMDNIGMMLSIKNPRVAATLAPAAVRGLIRKQGKHADAVDMHARHSAHFGLNYATDFPEMYKLYERAIDQQWHGSKDVDWNKSVDPLNPATALIPVEYLPIEQLAEKGIRLNEQEQQKLSSDWGAWLLSQFLHGEQGALCASAQVTESVHWLDGKLYGATQVMDEGRHVEVFLRYLDTKLDKLYPINDNLLVIIDALMTDSRWDMKFLGMQIMVEGLALGAFSTIYQMSKEPLLRQMLKLVIQDEARHVHYGVLALKDHIRELPEADRREREDWTYEVALLMRNRFLAHEIYEEQFSHRLSLKDWNEVMLTSPSMDTFRNVMFKRLIPNLEAISLMSERIRPHYEKAGLASFIGGKNATQLSGEDLVADADAAARATTH